MSARVAIVVGAGGELGRATVQKLATAGFTVVGVDRNEQGLKELPDGIRDLELHPLGIRVNAVGTATSRHSQEPAVPASRPAGARALTRGGR
jgi:NADP-dependent 3-hydroxy acid dehydrogenase YdfG